MDLLEISDFAKNQYRKFVKDSWNDSDELIRKKLTRNFIMGRECHCEKEGLKCRMFGALKIYINDNFKVEKIANLKGFNRCFINTVEKNSLNLILGIKEDTDER